MLPVYDGRNHSQFLGVGYISQVLQRAGHDTLIIDEDAVYSLLMQKDDKDHFLNTKKHIVSQLNNFSPDIIGITINTPNYERSLELLVKIRDSFPKTTIIVGGPQISTSWQVSKKYHQPLFDIAVVGEAENTILEICARIISNKPLANIKGTILSQDSESSLEPRKLIDDLDSLPYQGVSGCRAGQPFGEKYLYKWWKRACENLGIEGVDLYGGTRHSSATALRTVCSPEQIKIATMHSTNKAFERYFQPGMEDALNIYDLTRRGTQ